MASMYPDVNKEHLPSAPPSYSDSLNAPKYHGDPTNGQPQYAPTTAHQQPTQVIVVQGTSIPPLGPRSVHLTCPTCKSLVTTRIEEESSSSAYMCCLILFVVGCCLYSCLPFCMDNFKICNHSCPKCNAFIGSYKAS